MELHHINVQEAARALDADPQRGLSRQEVLRRQAKYGRNEIRAAGRQSLLARFLGQFQDFMVLILLLSAGVSFWASRLRGDNEYIDSIIILAIVICNAIIGTVQELRADKAIDALKKLSSPHAQVLREGKKRTVESWELVPGDLVVLRAGDLAPADLRLIRSADLLAEESALTGESAPVEKDAALLCPQDAPLAERRNTVFASTGIASGAGVGLVCATGMDTAMGRIAGLLEQEKSPETPLQQRLKQTGKVLGLGAVAICGVIFLLGLLQQVPPLEMFMIAISLGVAAIPEGLTAVVTIVLAMGVKRMAQKRAIVRHMPAVETLGSTQVICSDKTGTLTQNKMTVAAFEGAFGSEPLDGANAQFCLELCTLCNNSEEEAGGYGGDPTETAFLRACRKKKRQLEEEYPRVGEIPFSSVRKRMTTAHRLPGGGFRVITKGAPDVLIARCASQLRGSGSSPLTGAAKAKLLSDNTRLAGRALRVLAVAYKDVDRLPEDDQEIESGLTFCGLIGMEDPPRKEARAAVLECKRAGITPVMITGDHAATALAIAQRIGIAAPGDPVVTGPELDRLSEGELARKLDSCRVYARVSPQHKVKLVKACQRRGLVVAMTGDGVNDAPALKAADVGCAMGKNGTEVAKSAADMVLTDDNFSTIVSAVREGRGIYSNIRKAIHFLLSCNIGEILVVFAAFLLRAPAPGHPTAVGQPGDRLPARPGSGGRAHPPGCDGPAAPPAGRKRLCRRHGAGGGPGGLPGGGFGPAGLHHGPGLVRRGPYVARHWPHHGLRGAEPLSAGPQLQRPLPGAGAGAGAFLQRQAEPGLLGVRLFDGQRYSVPSPGRGVSNRGADAAPVGAGAGAFRRAIGRGGGGKAAAGQAFG